MAQAASVPFEAAVFRLRAAVEDHGAGRPDQRAEIARREPEPLLGTRGERGGLGLVGGMADRAPRGHPRAVSAVENAHRLEAVGVQAPPGPRRVQAGGVVVHDDRAPAADPGARDGPGDLVGRGEQDHRVGILGIDERLAPVEVRRVWDVARRVGEAPGPVGPPADVEHAELRPAEVLGQPVR